MGLLLEPEDLIHVMRLHGRPMSVRQLAAEVDFSESAVRRCIYAHPEKFSDAGGWPVMWWWY